MELFLSALSSIAAFRAAFSATMSLADDVQDPASIQHSICAGARSPLVAHPRRKPRMRVVAAQARDARVDRRHDDRHRSSSGVGGRVLAG